MHYNVSQLLKEPTGSERAFNIDDVEFGDWECTVDYASGSVIMVRTHHGIWVQGHLTVRVAQDCSRCLAEISQTLALELDEEYFPEIDVRTGRWELPPADWEGMYIGADHMLDLAEATRQSTLAVLPLKPLCKPDCAGICDRCGADRNRSGCACYDMDIDPRWAALHSLIIESGT